MNQTNQHDDLPELTTRFFSSQDVTHWFAPAGLGLLELNASVATRTEIDVPGKRKRSTSYQRSSQESDRAPASLRNREHMP
jgi:hypothetical protein